MRRLIPFDTHLNYGPMRMAIYQSGIDVTVESDEHLLNNAWGYYYESAHVILIDRRLTYTAKRCALVHELVHWAHGDNCCGLNERRTRIETAKLLIDRQDYARAEKLHEGNIWGIADELNVTKNIVDNYQIWLHDSVAAYKAPTFNGRGVDHYSYLPGRMRCISNFFLPCVMQARQ